MAHRPGDGHDHRSTGCIGCLVLVILVVALWSAFGPLGLVVVACLLFLIGRR